MAQLGHPYGDKVKASQRRRLKALGAHAGKPFGNAAMQQKKSYPKKNAGTEREMTISGGSGKHRADRMAAGGSVRRHKPHATTNIIISHAGGRGGFGGGGGAGGRSLPDRPPIGAPIGAGAPPIGAGGVPPIAPRPVGVPVGMPAGAPGLGGGLPVRPPIAPPVAGAGGLPPRPLGMRTGGTVKKRRAGGSLSPTTESEKRDQHSPGETIPAVRLRHGGGVKKRQLGGLGGGPTPAMMSTLPAQRGQPNISGRGAIPPLSNVATPMPSAVGRQLQPAPGTGVGFKKGGKTKKHARGGHVDEAEDKRLFKKMYKEEEAKEKPEKHAKGGLIGPKYHDQGVGKRKDGGITGLPGEVYRNEGRGEASGRAVANPWGISNPPGAVRKRAAGGFVPSNQDSKDPGLAGDKYHQQGVGFRKMGGDVGESRGMGPHMPGSAAGGLGRLEKTKMARSVPAKTES
jgi:hypothetical protein